MIILDVWGGYHSCEHVARFYASIKDALLLAEAEIEKGFLVNLRKDAEFGPEENWDSRKSN